MNASHLVIKEAPLGRGCYARFGQLINISVVIGVVLLLFVGYINRDNPKFSETLRHPLTVLKELIQKYFIVPTQPFKLTPVATPLDKRITPQDSLDPTVVESAVMATLTAVAQGDAPLPTNTPSPTFTLTPFAVVGNAPVDLRTGPSAAYPSIGKLATNAAITIIGQNPEGTWYKVCCANGAAAWVEVQRVKKTNNLGPMVLILPDHTPLPTSSAINTSTETIPNANITTPVQPAITPTPTGRIFTVSPLIIPCEHGTSVSSGSGAVTPSPCLRSTPSLVENDQSKIGDATATSKINTLIQNAVKATLTAVETKTPLPSSTPTPFVTAKNGLVDLRTGPGFAYPTIGGKLGINVPVPIVGQNQGRDWFQICCVSGATVWVSATDVTVTHAISGIAWVNVEPPPPPTPTPTITPISKASSP